MRTINFSDARGNLKQVLDRVVDDADVTIITRRDAEDVVVMPLSTWNSWKETEYLLASPANARRLLTAIADLDAGRGVRRQLIDRPKRHSINEERAQYNVKAKAKQPRRKRKTRG
jgi:antitoxin YefM